MNDLMSHLPLPFLQNQFLSGGLVLMIVAAAGAVVRHLPRMLLEWLKRRIAYSVEVAYHERGFEWLQFWLHHQPQMQGRKAYRAVWQGGGESNLLFVPVEGHYVLLHRGRILLVWIEREKLSTPVSASRFSSLVLTHRESIHLTCCGSALTGRRTVEALLAEAYECLVTTQRGLIHIHAPIGESDAWGTQALRKPRSPESLVLRHGVLELLHEDLRRFHSSSEWYARMGIPWRRGYLLEGAPGNGKTSAILALAGIMEHGIAVLSLSDVTMTDARLLGLIRSLPEKTFLALEDVDAIFNKRVALSHSQVTFSGLLNAIDGILCTEGRILFMTSNHPEQLDPALIRPGRVDRRVTITNPTAEQARRLFLRFFPDAESLADRFASCAESAHVSMAVLQEHCLAHRDDAEGAVRNLRFREPGEAAA